MRLPRRAPSLVVTTVAALLLLCAGPAAATPTVPAHPPLAPVQAPGAPSAQWSLTSGSGPLSVVDRNDYDEQSGTPAEVPSPSGGGKALQFTVPGGQQRSEVRPRVPRVGEGDVQDVTYRAQLAKDFPTDADGWQIFLQWHQSSDDGSPPVALEINKGRLLLDNGERHQTEIGRVNPGDTLDLRVRVLFSKDPSTGRVDVWSGGRQVLTGYRPPEGTLQSDGRNYMKTGIYRSDSIEQDARLTLENLDVSTGSGPDALRDTPSGGGLTAAIGAAVLLLVAAAGALVLVRRARRRVPTR